MAEIAGAILLLSRRFAFSPHCNLIGRFELFDGTSRLNNNILI